MKTVKLKINGLEVEVPEGTNLLNAAKQAQVKIPSLCYHPDLPAWAAWGGGRWSRSRLMDCRHWSRP